MDKASIASSITASGPHKPSTSSYAQILKSSSIVGGAQFVVLLIGLIRTKFAAILLGPSGIGMISLYTSATAAVATVAGLGLSASGVRQIAEAHGTGDALRLARTAVILNRLAAVSGVIGLCLTYLLAPFLSQWAFGNDSETSAIILLAATLLFGSISNGQIALVQGMRLMQDLARIQISTVLAGTVVTLLLYIILSYDGIIPALLASSAISLIVSSYFSWKIKLPTIHLTWRQTISEARSLIAMGVAFMWSALLTTGIALATRALILQSFGAEGNGYYQAAWALSAMFAEFILQAMGTDFYPRLTASISSKADINILINEQTEVGALLATPGLLATIAFSPLLIQAFYTSHFSVAANLIPWFAIGIFGKIVSWPLGMVLPAKGRSLAFGCCESLFGLLHITLIFLFAKFFGIVGVAYAYAVLYVFALFILYIIVRNEIGFFYTLQCLGILTLCTAALIAMLTTPLFISSALLLFTRVLLLIATAILCFRCLLHRLDPSHRIVRIVASLPLARHCISKRCSQ